MGPKSLRCELGNKHHGECAARDPDLDKVVTWKNVKEEAA